ncbi:venom metalloproteinase antarease-like TtrivMP_A isoform X2 [Dermacentor silvarum]|uniref:venom metalloproteinase antarease-like TtrivMP_A isoform X2 n=1 Tax=Dermacentor silvarum TaxID=543639 RepID=UPI002100C667|nr:venom metalloproteinase antarease-like TtrivMP_A isoform X2 [Dermacentor silvarum]
MWASPKMHMIFVALFILAIEGKENARLVYPRLLEERSSDGRMVVHVHDDLTLNLRKSSVAAGEIRVLTEEDGRRVTRFYNGEDIEKHLYEDEEKIAAVMLTTTENGVRMEGLVGPKHRIQPTPISGRSEDGVVPHEIHEIEQKEMLDKTLSYRREDVPSERSSLYAGMVPAVVTVEIFIVSDKKHHRYFSRTELELRYLCILMNAANLRYKATSNPRVKLLLSGLERSQKEDYIMSPEDGYLFDDLTIMMFKQHAVKHKSEYGNPDCVYLMTGLNVFTFYQGRMTDAGLGIGYVSGVCTSHFVALGEDEPGQFSGTHTFAHEIAHLLGAKHDGDGPDPDIPGHPGAVGCPWSDGYMMSYVNKGPEFHRFSPCSLSQIRHVVSRAGSACWKVSSQGSVVKHVYPGMAVTFKQFCSALPTDKENSTYEYATVNQSSCKVRCHFSTIYTYVWQNGVRKNYKLFFTKTQDALDYMPCGDHHVCIQGVCLEKNSPIAVTEDELTTDQPASVTEVSAGRDTETTETTPTIKTTTRKFPWRHTRRRYLGH